MGKKLKDLKEAFDLFVNTVITEILKDSFPEVYEPVLYSLLNGGKRIRPILFLLLSGYHESLSEEEKKEYFYTAVSIEAIHTYSLIHDDLPSMDNDDMRRGKPSCHIVFPEWAAILAGDSLNTFAFYLLSQTKKNVREKLEILSQYAGIMGMIFGQALDMSYEKKNFPYKENYYTKNYLLNKIDKFVYNKNFINFFNNYIDDINFLKLFLIHYGKTASLFKAIGKLSVIVGNIKNEFPIVAYTEILGFIFQIVDDLLDEIGLEEKLGKKVRKDQEKGKITFVRILGIERSQRIVELLAENASILVDDFELPYTQKDNKEYLKALPYYLIKRQS